MELLLNRKTRTQNSTIGELSIDGKFECFVLEDKDRGLKQTMSKSELSNLKIKGETCIPDGRYEVAISFSDKFKKLLPLLLDVPCFEGIRIHSGNFATDTEGCLLPGQSKGTDAVSSSRLAFTALFSKINAALKREKVFITIK